MPGSQATALRALYFASGGDQPSLLMQEKQFTWPFPFGFLNTLKEDNPTVYKAFQLAWSVATTNVLHVARLRACVCERCTRKRLVSLFTDSEPHLRERSQCGERMRLTMAPPCHAPTLSC